jgi:hypothetical protein
MERISRPFPKIASGHNRIIPAAVMAGRASRMMDGIRSDVDWHASTFPVDSDEGLVFPTRISKSGLFDAEMC